MKFIVSSSLLLLVATTVLLLLTISTTTIQAFQFSVTPSQKICFAHESTADSNTVTLAYVIHATEGSGTMHVNILSPTKTAAVTSTLKLGGKDESMNFNTAMAGRWDVCLTWASDFGCRMELDIDATVDMNFRDPSVKADEYTTVTDKVLPLFEKAEYEIDYLAHRSERFEKTVSSTYFRVVVFTILEFAIAIIAVAWQIITLRKFFKEKKVA